MAPPEQTVSPALVASPRPIKAKPVAPVNIGRWTDEEHAIFLDQLRLHNRDWKKISAAIPSRTIVQIRTHAQKFFQGKEKKRKLGSTRPSSSSSSSSSRRAANDSGCDDNDDERVAAKTEQPRLLPVSVDNSPLTSACAPSAPMESWAGLDFRATGGGEGSPTGVAELKKEWSLVEDERAEPVDSKMLDLLDGIEPLPTALGALSRWMDEL